MKKSFIVLAAVIITALSANCQQVKVPDAVKNAFNYRFPAATNVKWGKENATEFEAEFKSNGNPISANFKTNGDWVETETTIAITDLPDAVSSAIHKKYPGSEITSAEKSEKPGGNILYEVVIKLNNKKKELEIKPDGGFAK